MANQAVCICRVPIVRTGSITTHELMNLALSPTPAPTCISNTSVAHIFKRKSNDRCTLLCTLSSMGPTFPSHVAHANRERDGHATEQVSRIPIANRIYWIPMSIQPSHAIRQIPQVSKSNVPSPSFVKFLSSLCLISQCHVAEARLTRDGLFSPLPASLRV